MKTKFPRLVVCDSAGSVMEVPEYAMVSAAAGSMFVPDKGSLVPLPKESVFYVLPGRLAVGYDESWKRFVTVKEYAGKPVFAAAAHIPPGYVQTGFSAFRETANGPRLPLFCYTAVGWNAGRFYASANRVDVQKRHEITDDLFKTVGKRARVVAEKYPGNRLVRHLVDNCVYKYRCPNACNFVLGRWECPVPVSKACNASCIGCISLQPKGSCVPSTQHRLDFTPTSQEIVEYVVPHLAKAAQPIASFGQGCEGEPLLQATLIEEAIRGIRSKTKRGVLNINTNASLPHALERLCRAGLNSMRVSLNSAQPDFYRAYYRPAGYSFEDVCESIETANRFGVWVSLNYLVFPGFTDHRSELSALKKLLNKHSIHMIQTRNLNIDPLWYCRELGLHELKGKRIGIAGWVGTIKKEFPEVKIGYFNPAKSPDHDGVQVAFPV
jgi:wyosine [tRNA(Phe)-imidazoG37] synthetase (radical SAM superfamily)